VAALADALKN